MKKFDKIFWMVSILLALFWGSQQLQAADGVDVRQAKTMNEQGALLLDVREREEYSAVHAPNAQLIPLGELASRINEISEYKNKPVAVICRSGRRSSKAVSMLKEAGYTQVSNVKGGMSAWESEGLSVMRL